VILTALERVLVHLHGYWNAREPSRATTQAGIAEGARILRSHVPRAVKTLFAEGLVDSEDARLVGRARKTKVYRLTEAGIRRARVILESLDGMAVDVDGRRTSLGEARRDLGLGPLAALGAVDPQGRLRAASVAKEATQLLGRDEDLAVLRRWRAGPASVAVVYGSRGMGKTALGRAYARTVPRSAWVDLEGIPDLEAFAVAIEQATGRVAATPTHPQSVARAMLEAFAEGTKLLVLDGFSEVPEAVVESLEAFLRLARGHPEPKVLVLAEESTPAYCRFYGRREIESGTVVERHLKGLDLEDCRTMLGNPGIEAEALRRIFLLTKGCPLYLRFIREGDEAGLRTHSRFTKAEIRLLLYSGGALGASTSAR